MTFGNSFGISGTFQDWKKSTFAGEAVVSWHNRGPYYGYGQIVMQYSEESGHKLSAYHAENRQSLRQLYLIADCPKLALMHLRGGRKGGRWRGVLMNLMGEGEC